MYRKCNSKSRLGVGQETRLNNDDKSYYSLVHENEIIHQTIITAD